MIAKHQGFQTREGTCPTVPFAYAYSTRKDNSTLKNRAKTKRPRKKLPHTSPGEPDRSPHTTVCEEEQLNQVELCTHDLYSINVYVLSSAIFLVSRVSRLCLHTALATFALHPKSNKTNVGLLPFTPGMLLPSTLPPVGCLSLLPPVSCPRHAAFGIHTSSAYTLPLARQSQGYSGQTSARIDAVSKRNAPKSFPVKQSYPSGRRPKHKSSPVHDTQSSGRRLPSPQPQTASFKTALRPALCPPHRTAPARRQAPSPTSLLLPLAVKYLFALLLFSSSWDYFFNLSSKDLFPLIFFCSWSRPYSRASAVGGQPGT